MVEKNEVLFDPTGKVQEGDLYKAEDSQVYELKRKIVTTADGNAYRCFRLEPAKGLGHANLPLRPPKIVVDSHMHIQSSHTSTLPFLRSHLKGLPFRRSVIDGAAAAAGVIHDDRIHRPILEGWNRAFERPNKDGGYSRGLGYAEACEASSGTTYEVGQRFLAKIDQLVQDLRDVKPYRQAADVLGLGIVMTMDMEYAHLFGYYGIKIYNPVYLNADHLKNEAEPEGIWYPWRKDGELFRPGDGLRAPNYSAEGETLADFKAFARSRARDGLAGSVSNPGGGSRKTVRLNCEIREAPKKEAKDYETWKKQLRYTKQVVIEGGLRLLPMYHYDPRRWQGGDSEAFRHVGEEGIFLGFKMYTAQGYRPWDPRLPNLASFYAKCSERGIPILNHCTSEGAPTYDREDYFDHVHPLDDAEEDKRKLISAAWWHEASPGKKDTITVFHRKDGSEWNWDKAYKDYSKKDIVDILKGNIPIDQDRYQDIVDHLRRQGGTRANSEGKVTGVSTEKTRVGYFNDHFVSPYAWRIVLDQHPNLRLCLAHFGGNKDTERVWAHEIARMMGEKDQRKPDQRKYPNFYADISSSFGDAKFREFFKELLKTYPHIRQRTLFGTDWYPTLLGIRGMDVLNYCKTAKEFFDGIDKTLWPQITEENPCRFYRLGEQIGRIAENLIMEKGREVNQEDTRDKTWKSGEAQQHAAESKKEQESFCVDVRKRAQLIQERATVVMH